MDGVIASTESISQLVHRHAKTIASPEHKFSDTEVNTLQTLDTVLSWLDPKCPNVIFPIFEVTWHPRHTVTLAGFKTNHPTAIAALAKHTISGSAHDKTHYFDSTAIEKLCTIHLIETCKLGDAFNLAQLTPTSATPKKIALSDVISRKLAQFLTLKDRMGNAADGITFYVGTRDNHYHVIGCSIQSQEAYNYLAGRGLTPPPITRRLNPWHTETIEYKPPPYAKGMCLGSDTLQRMLTFVQPSIGGGAKGVGAIGR